MILACRVRLACPILSLTWAQTDLYVGPDGRGSHVVVVRPGGQIQRRGYLVTPRCELPVEASEFADVSGRCERARSLVVVGCDR